MKRVESGVGGFEDERGPGSAEAARWIRGE
jgi:hypothetical protein